MGCPEALFNHGGAEQGFEEAVAGSWHVKGAVLCFATAASILMDLLQGQVSPLWLSAFGTSFSYSACAGQAGGA